MDLDTLFIVDHCFKHGAPLAEIKEQLHLEGEDASEAAIYLCDHFGVEAVFPPKKSVRHRQLEVA